MINSFLVGHRARALWISLRSSLWFTPGVIVGFCILAALVLVEFSARIDAKALEKLPRLFGAGASGSREMLATIAGSVITVAGVTFSITIVALAQASTQYTPRVLRTFMSDRASQVVLGSFIGIFAYCLVVLRTIRGGDEGSFIPSVAVLGGFALALVAVGMLIFYIHHIASSLQASVILERVRRTTEVAIRDLYPDALCDDVDDDGEAIAARTDAGERGAAWRPIPSRATGYLQSVDMEGLVALARERDIVLCMECAVGDFVVAGNPIARNLDTEGTKDPNQERGDDMAADLGAQYTISAHRTVEQDPAFGILQIVDIALKALSPGINDSTTAVTCVDHLSALLACVGQRRIGPRVRCEGGSLRAIEAGPTYSDLVALSLNDIRRNAERNIRVLTRLLEAIAVASRAVTNPARRQVLERQLDLIAEAAERSLPAPGDRVTMARRIASVRRDMASRPVTSGEPADVRLAARRGVTR